MENSEQAYCEHCKKVQPAELTFFNPDEDSEPTLWVCSVCKEAIYFNEEPTWLDSKGRTVIIKSMSDRWLNNIRKKFTGERRKIIKPILEEIERRKSL